MSDRNTSDNFFYDSDEDVAWGPRTFREVKKDLTREKKIPPNYRRQTASFIPCPAENNSEMYTIANSSHSSKDYFTANESLDSNNIQSKEEMPLASSITIPDENGDSENFSSLQNKIDTSDCPEVITVYSDSEDEHHDLELSHVKIERFSRSQSTKYNSFSIGEESSHSEIICLSSSEDEPEPYKDMNESRAQIQDTSFDSIEDGQTPKIQSIANTPVKKVNHSLNQSANQDSSLSSVNEEEETPKISRQKPRIRIIAKTPVKRSTDSLNCSLVDGKQNSSFTTMPANISRSISETPIKQFNHSLTQNDSFVTRNQHKNWTVAEEGDKSNDEIVADTPEKQLNYSSDNFYYRDHFLAQENEKLESPKPERQIPKINIISNTPIKGPNNISMNDSADEGSSSVYDYQKSKPTEILNQSEDHIEIDKDSSENRNLYESPSSNIQNTSINEHLPVSLNTSLYRSLNSSQKDNDYDYCEEINHTLSSKLELDLSLKNSEEIYNTACDSVTSNKLDISGIHSIPKSSFNNSKNDSIISNDFNNAQNDSISSKEIHNTHDDSMCDNHDNSGLNDTFAEMERLLTKGFDSDSDDSSEDIIESTSCDNSRPAFGNSSIHNISRIPVPRSLSDDSRSNSSITNEFKIPKFPPKVIKKTPINNRVGANKTSPLPLKNIISPVRLYINNSPFAALKQNNKPGCTKLQRNLGGISENTMCTPKKRRNLLDSLPEVVYKPSRLIKEKCDDQIILPNNIRKLITERIVIKHEPRKRISPDESMYSVGDKLNMRDLSVIVSDDQNMSVHTTKQGFNL